MVRASIFLAIVASAVVARALPETQLATFLPVKIEELERKGFVRSSFASFDQTKISIATIAPPNARGTIVISPGRTESITGFMEVIGDLVDASFAVAIVDHRGQGHSGRAVEGSDVGHVESFVDYQKDFAHFVDGHVVGKLPAPYFLLADSMGAPIALDYLIGRPEVFRAAVLAAPLVKVTTPVPEPIVAVFAKVMKFLGFGTSRVLGSKPYDPGQKFEGNPFTHSEVRFLHDVSITKKDPTIATGGPSNSWILAAFDVTRDLRERAPRLKVPTLLIQAGGDSIVDLVPQKSFCERAANCRTVQIADALHWILFEADRYRDPLFAHVLAFYSEHEKAITPSASSEGP